MDKTIEWWTPPFRIQIQIQKWISILLQDLFLWLPCTDIWRFQPRTIIVTYIFHGFRAIWETIYIQFSLFWSLDIFFSAQYNRTFELFVLSRNQKDQMQKLLKIIRRRFSRFQLNHSPHPFPICSERLWHEKCVVNISREGKKYFPILRLMYFLHSLCTSRLLCELTQWVEYKFHVFGFLPSNSSIHAILP